MPVIPAQSDGLTVGESVLVLLVPNDSYYIPKRNARYIFSTELIDSASRPDFKSSPTIAAGDFQVSTDDSPLANLTTIPEVAPAGGVLVRFIVEAAEMNGDRVNIVGIDAAGAEWDDIGIGISPATRQITEDDGIAAATLDADLDTYQAKVVFIDDDTGALDLYTVNFFKNGEPITTGITSPTIQVLKALDATDLIANTALTEIGSLGLYKHSETTNRIVDGDGYIAKVQAMIDNATRTWHQPVGRDD